MKSIRSISNIVRGASKMALRGAVARGPSVAVRSMGAPALASSFNRTFVADSRMSSVRSISDFKKKYDGHVAERAAQGIVPKPLSAAQTNDLVEMLKNPDPSEHAFLLDLLTNRIPPGVDEAA